MVEREISGWRHVFKLDPDKYIDDKALEAVCLSGTDAIIVGGSSGVDYENTYDLLSRLRRFDVSCALEVTALDGAVPGFDLYFAPIALNAGHIDYIVGLHHRALKQFGGILPWDKVAAEGYIIANPGCTAARVAGVRERLAEADAVAYARYADRLLRLPIVYLEYSGVFGDLELVAEVKSTLVQAQLFYGGGIESAEKAAAAAAVADTVIVGNAVYEAPAQALETVRAVKGQ